MGDKNHVCKTLAEFSILITALEVEPVVKDSIDFVPDFSCDTEWELCSGLILLIFVLSPRYFAA